MILPDWIIRQYSLGVWNAALTNPESNPEAEKDPIPDRDLINPYSLPVSGDKIISYGESSAGYDLRLDHILLQYNKNCDEIIDPKRFSEPGYKEKVFITHNIPKGESYTLRPHDYVLGMSVEYIKIPSNILALCIGKSTYARSMVFINTTPLEPGWEGHLTIEIGNLSPLRAKIYPGEGIAQLVFFELKDFPQTDYKKKNGKYQNQLTVQPPIVR